jgi:Arc/MetJ-type ribon-helix-helix transcriptional regulator
MTIHLNPEQERIIREEIRSGHFRSADEVLDHALASLRENEQKSGAPARPCKSLVDVLSQPPFAGSELDLERQRDYPRPPLRVRPT